MSVDIEIDFEDFEGYEPDDDEIAAMQESVVDAALDHTLTDVAAWPERFGMTAEDVPVIERYLTVYYGGPAPPQLSESLIRVAEEILAIAKWRAEEPDADVDIGDDGRPSGGAWFFPRDTFDAPALRRLSRVSARPNIVRRVPLMSGLRAGRHARVRRTRSARGSPARQADDPSPSDLALVTAGVP